MISIGVANVTSATILTLTDPFLGGRRLSFLDTVASSSRRRRWRDDRFETRRTLMVGEGHPLVAVAIAARDH